MRESRPPKKGIRVLLGILEDVVFSRVLETSELPAWKGAECAKQLILSKLRHLNPKP